jgi:hypothetical protein
MTEEKSDFLTAVIKFVTIVIIFDFFHEMTEEKSAFLTAVIKFMGIKSVKCLSLSIQNLLT